MKRLNFDKKRQRQLRHTRTFKKLKALQLDKPRLVVSKSNSHLVAQIIDDKLNKTLVSSSTIQLKLKHNNIENAKLVGTDLAKKAKACQIESVSFDRGGSKYHGKIAALANAAREGGLKF